jgi:8-oxo-dGTP pyrophosphatase MutT (NUDIX family)
MATVLGELLDAYESEGSDEAVALDRIRSLVAHQPDPYLRSTPLHVTASALIVHPPTRRVLMRWHARQQAWLHVGGHGDPGEGDPLAIAMREGEEETGLTDLVPWPSPALRHVDVVQVAASAAEPEHEHADLRFVLATDEPDAARPENPSAALRWMSSDEAYQLTDRLGFRELLSRVTPLLG